MRSGAPHVGAAKELVRALSDRRELAAGLPLAALAGAAARALPLPRETRIVPVPKHRRNRRRGFHPAAEIARHLSRDLGLRVVPRQLRRVRPEANELVSLAGRERAARGAFRSRSGAGAH
ncbi:MAG: ComF family protein, partial [Planctomycetota bacterium]